MKKIDVQKVFSFLGLILRCPVCTEKYQLSQLEVIESEEDEFMQESKVLLHSNCLKCRATVLFNIDICGPDIFSVGMVTDLTSEDSMKFKDMDSLTPNDVIDIHLALQGNSFDFKKALRVAKT